MAATPMIHVRVHEQIKAQATGTLASMGFTVPDAVRVLLIRAAELLDDLEKNSRK